MGGREESLNKTGGGGSPWKHSGNQGVEKRRREAGEKLFGKRDKAVEDALRRKRIERSRREFEERVLEDDPQEGLRFLEERRQFQLCRALKHVYNGTATLQDIDYFFRHADELGQTAIVGGETIVDFEDPAKKDLRDAA